VMVQLHNMDQMQLIGVINIILKKNTELTVDVNGGAYFSKNSDGHNQGGTDGETMGISLNYGVGIGKKGGFLNLTGMLDNRNSTNRMIEWEGNIFNSYNSIERNAQDNGYGNLLGLQTDFDGIVQYAQGAGLPSNVLTDVNNATTIGDLQSALSTDNTETELAARDQERWNYNMRVGQSKLGSGKFFFNGEFPLSEKTAIYTFGGLSYRNGESAGFYRSLKV